MRVTGANSSSTPKTDRSAVRQIIAALQAAGYELTTVNDGEEVTRVANAHHAEELIFGVDAATLYVVHTRYAANAGHVLFVLGNSPEEVAADYTTNLSDAIEPLTSGWW